jgi:protein SSD1
LHPFGVLEREIGLVSDINVQTQALLADNNVTDSEFSEAIMNCLPDLPWTPSESEIEDRREFKNTRIFTVEEQKQGKLSCAICWVSLCDSNNVITKDIFLPAAAILDRALSITKVGDDTYEIGLHLADVAHFIKPHSPLDKEARARATVVEVVNKTVPMLPAELTTQVTNLEAGKDR